MHNVTFFFRALEDGYNEQTAAWAWTGATIDALIAVIGQNSHGTSGGIESLAVEQFFSSSAIRSYLEKVQTDYFVLCLSQSEITPGQFAMERLIQVSEATGAGMIYADYLETKNGVTGPHPLIEYQKGSLRDDFNFGGLLFFKTAAAREAVAAMDQDYEHAGLYDLRLRISEKHRILHLNEYLYTMSEPDVRKSGEKLFDYVDPKNRAVQIEMEWAVTAHLLRVGGYLHPEFDFIAVNEQEFPVELSVIIPVKDRNATIGNAIESALKQKTEFPFNVIVIDNHSTDGTSEKVAAYAKSDNRVIHIIPDRTDLGIGGCWNVGVHSPLAGKFVVQLDSDDLYNGPDTLKKIATVFYIENCAMVIGSYQMTNFALEEIPPGLIDHKEWTPENGRNNALRINGLGAPRAFYTPVLRKINFPNTSYGEDYAVALAVSRIYQIGRIYEPLYLCRRWEGNSDASLGTQKLNEYNFYKDKIRTLELEARIRLNAENNKQP